MAEGEFAGSGPSGKLFAFGGHAPRVDEPESFWIAPGAIMLGNVRVRAGASIWFGAVIRADNEPMTIGGGANIQDCCVLHSDPGFPLSVGAEATIGHRAILHGCSIGAGALIGMGATVMNGAVVGENSVVGAGAVVPEGVSIPPNSLAVGLPARVIRELEDEHRVAGRTAARHYRELAQRYRQELYSAVPLP